MDYYVTGVAFHITIAFQRRVEDRGGGQSDWSIRVFGLCTNP